MSKAAQSAKVANIIDEIRDVAEIDLNELMEPAKDAAGRPNFRYGLSAKGEKVFVDCADNFHLVRAGTVIQRREILTSVK